MILIKAPLKVNEHPVLIANKKDKDFYLCVEINGEYFRLSGIIDAHIPKEHIDFNYFPKGHYEHNY